MQTTKGRKRVLTRPQGPLLDLLSVPGKLSSSPPTEATRWGPLFRG